MSGLQIFFLILTFAAPAVLWAVGARNKSERFERNAARSQAILLLLIELNDLVSKMMGTTAITRHILPMQLCDWALIATALALWFRWQTCFEVAYFWGLSGTTQALITPAIHQDIPWWYQFGFFMAHSTIVAGVLFLLLTTRLRPRLQSWRA